jgi:hypothetical protein
MTKPAKPIQKGAFKKSLHRMNCLDVYLNGLNAKDLEQVKEKIGVDNRPKYPLLCWDVFSMYLHQLQNQSYDKRRKDQPR